MVRGLRRPARRESGLRVATLSVLAVLAATGVACRRAEPAGSATPILVSVGVGPDGRVEPPWRDAIAIWHRGGTLDSVLAAARPLSAVERAWADSVRARAEAWSASTDSLRLPFEGIAAPQRVVVVVGNVGGQDAFTPNDSTVAFDVERLSSLYGVPGEGENPARIDRFFAHEFTHLLHRAWRRQHPVRLETALDRALWDCLVEGLGNYRSLSSRWVGPGGSLTPHALTVLDRLAPVFVERLAALAHADSAEEARLTADLSMGAFDRKWGALPTALWLAAEAEGDERRLRRWVAAGPRGILELARTHLPDSLAAGLPTG